MAPEYLIYLPEAYSGRKQWPLVIFLHGSGERGSDLARIRKSPVLRLRLPAIVVVPQCLPSYSWEADGVARLTEDLAARFHVDRKRIYLVGFSMGASGAWQTAAARPELFAAVVPISGGGNPKNANTLRNVAIWAFHGSDDKVVPVVQAQQTIDALRSTGGNPKLTILIHAGHGICDDVCRRTDLWQWLMAQRQSQ
jgi:predicted peptidase